MKHRNKKTKRVSPLFVVHCGDSRRGFMGLMKALVHANVHGGHVRNGDGTLLDPFIVSVTAPTARGFANYEKQTGTSLLS